jgi:hypothetical protein
METSKLQGEKSESGLVGAGQYPRTENPSGASI